MTVLYCAQSFIALNPDAPLLCTRDTGHEGPHATTIGETIYSGPERDGQSTPTDYGADCVELDRHPKWVRVEPGTVIPAGQPYRVEPNVENRGPLHQVDWIAKENVGKSDDWELGEFINGFRDFVFVDSSWKPPLVLPTEPSVIRANSNGELMFGPDAADQWVTLNGEWWVGCDLTDVRVIWTLTDEQVARIEAHR